MNEIIELVLLGMIAIVALRTWQKSIDYSTAERIVRDQLLQKLENTYELGKRLKKLEEYLNIKLEEKEEYIKYEQSNR